MHAFHHIKSLIIITQTMLCSFNLLGWVNNVDIPYILEISTHLTSVKKPKKWMSVIHSDILRRALDGPVKSQE